MQNNLFCLFLFVLFAILVTDAIQFILSWLAVFFFL